MLHIVHPALIVDIIQ